MSIIVTPIPRLIDLTAPAFTLGTANAAGSAITAVASDSTLLAFDTTLPAPVGTAATGSAVVTARRDHVHSGGYAKVGTFTRDTAAASGNQSITGVGFTPKAILFMGGQSSTAEVAWGLSDGTNENDLYNRNTISAGTWGIGNNRALTFVEDGTKDYSGTVASLDSDGFTITWTRTNTPTGTLTIMYLAVG